MRIGIIGLGGMATSYLRSLARLEEPVAAVCDLDEERALQVAQEQHARAYTDHREMLARERLDAVFVAIPPGAHSTQVADAAAARAAVFVARPVAWDMETALRTLEAVQGAGVINQVGYQDRYSDVAEWAQALVDRPLALGFGRFLCRMSPAHPWWGKKAISGGQLVEQSTQVFDLLRFFLGDIVSVQAFGHHGLGEEIADFEDSTVCNLRFKSGAVGSVVSSYLARAAQGFSVEFTGRDLHVRFLADLHLVGMKDGEPVEYTGEETGYFRQVDGFLRALRTGDQKLVRSSYADAVRTLAATLAATRSLETGQVETVEG